MCIRDRGTELLGPRPTALAHCGPCDVAPELGACSTAQGLASASVNSPAGENVNTPPRSTCVSGGNRPTYGSDSLRGKQETTDRRQRRVMKTAGIVTIWRPRQSG